MNYIYSVAIGGLAAVIFIVALVKSSRTKKVLLTAAIVATGVGLSFTGAIYAQELKTQQWLEEKELEYSTLVSELQEDKVIEYGSEYSDSLEGFTIVYNESQINTKVVGEGKQRITYADSEDYKFTVDYKYEVRDTVMPTIEGMENLELKYGDKLDLSKLEIKGKDPIDGELDASVSGTIDWNTPGKYTISVHTVDNNENKTEGSFIVTIGPKPVPKQTSNHGSGGQSNQSGQGSVPVKKAPAKQGNQSIRFHSSGRIVNYRHFTNSEASQGYIDNNKWNGTTWSYGEITHSNTDGKMSYFAAHASHAFSVAMYMKPGELVTVKDSTGHEQTYKVVKRDVYNVGSDGYFPDAFYDNLNVEGESIMIQTCLTEDSVENSVTLLRPV